MKKTIYKNQLVSYIHALSGKSYKEARQICKAAKWNEEAAVIKAFHFDQSAEALARVSNDLARAFNEMGETIRKAMISVGPALQTIADSMRQSAENMIQNDT